MGILRTMTKWAERIEKPTEAARLTQEAFRQLGAGRPRPVGLECPMDVWGCAAPVTPPNGPAEETVVDVDIDGCGLSWNEGAGGGVNARRRLLLVRRGLPGRVGDCRKHVVGCRGRVGSW